MLSLTDSGDRHGRKMLEIDQNLSDTESRFFIRILSGDFMPKFENSQHRKVDLAIVDGFDFQGSENEILIPLAVTGGSRIDGKVKTYYRQRYDSQDTPLSAQIQLDGFIVTDENESGNVHDFGEPCLLIKLGVDQNASQQGQIVGGEQQMMSSGINLGAHLDRGPHVDKDELANGGLNLPTGSVKSDDAEQQRRIAEMPLIGT